MPKEDIQIIPEGTDNYGTVLHPETNAGNVMGGTFPEIVKAFPNTSHTIAQVTGIIKSPDNADVNLMQEGEIWIKYK